jgi:hypothetical protein
MTSALLPVRHCVACQADTTSDATCPFCASTVGDDGVCLVCRQPVAPLLVCHGCGNPRDEADEMGLLRLEVRRLERLNAQNANRVQAYRLLVALMIENPTFTVKVACAHTGIDYDAHILNRRI